MKFYKKSYVRAEPEKDREIGNRPKDSCLWGGDSIFGKPKKCVIPTEIQKLKKISSKYVFDLLIEV